MPIGEGAPGTGPNIDREHATLTINIAKKAEKVLGNRKIDRVDFTEPPGRAHTKTDYSYKSGESKRSGSLLVKTDLPDRMTITHDAIGNTVSLEYEERGFGTLLQTILVKDQSGYPNIMSHYTNASEAVLTELLTSMNHRLEYADQELTKRE